MPTDRTACHCVVCRQTADLAPRTQAAADTMDRHGWQVVGVPADERGPGWAYTIGLWHQHRVPELF